MTPLLVLLLSTLLTAVPTTTFGLGCPSGCSCNDKTLVVQCEGGKLDVVPITLNPAIQRLLLRNNKIRVVDAAFQFYMDLQYVDMSGNHLVSIPTESFRNQQKLQELHLNKNKLNILNNTTFAGLKALTVLNLRENFLEEITKGVFSILPKLEELNLSQNRISKIEEGAFSGLLSLRVLYLDDNLLTSVPSNTFSGVASLAELHLGLNAFYTLPDEAFAGLSKLSVLDLGSGGINNISQQAFKGLTSLRNLNLADNRLQTIPTTQLGLLERLEELTIGQNSFGVIKKESFKGLKNLRKIDVSGDKELKQIEAGAFADNMNLETINIVANKKLESLDEGSLGRLPNLRHLVLRENSLRTLLDTAISWNELRTLDLSDNPLHCDCQLLWLVVLINKRNFTSVECSNPTRSLKDLTMEDLGCSYTDPRQRAAIVTLCLSALIILAVLGLFFFRYRLKVRDALKDYKFDKSAEVPKESEYEENIYENDYTLHSTEIPVKYSGTSEHYSFENKAQRPWEVPAPAGTIPVTGFTYIRANDGCRVHSLRTLKVDMSSTNEYAECPVDFYTSLRTNGVVLEPNY
ncbi:leucine-rich repeat neuronal protein 2-like isoform X2 [Anthonomus grandis grandis]|nr:leucine-rich repeat neuronal protein 2-like isoform X2 [Anthonomus grandis grandis]